MQQASRRMREFLQGGANGVFITEAEEACADSVWC